MFDRNKFILQFGNLAGWPFLIAKELRKRGIPSKNIIRWYSDVHDLKRDLTRLHLLNNSHCFSWGRGRVYNCSRVY